MDNLVPPATLSSQPAVDHLTLFDAFRAAFEYALASIQWPASDKPVLVKEFPKTREGKFDDKFDVILYKVCGSRIASTSNGSPRRPTGLSLLRVVDHPSMAGYKQVMVGWQEEVSVEFTVLAKSNQRADELATWFHRMIMVYAHGMMFFKSRGINYLVFQERLEDSMTKDFGQELYKRPLRYNLRLDLQDTAAAKTWDSLSVRVD